MLSDCNTCTCAAEAAKDDSSKDINKDTALEGLHVPVDTTSSTPVPKTEEGTATTTATANNATGVVAPVAAYTGPRGTPPRHKQSGSISVTVRISAWHMVVTESFLLKFYCYA